MSSLGPAAAAVVQDLERLAHLLQAGVLVYLAGARPSADAVEDGGQVEDLAARLEERGVQGGLRGQWFHDEAE